MDVCRFHQHYYSIAVLQYVASMACCLSHSCSLSCLDDLLAYVHIVQQACLISIVLHMQSASYAYSHCFTCILYLCSLHDDSFTMKLRDCHVVIMYQLVRPIVAELILLQLLHEFIQSLINPIPSLRFIMYHVFADSLLVSLEADDGILNMLP